MRRLWYHNHVSSMNYHLNRFFYSAWACIHTSHSFPKLPSGILLPTSLWVGFRFLKQFLHLNTQEEYLLFGSSTDLDVVGASVIINQKASSWRKFFSLATELRMTTVESEIWLANIHLRIWLVILPLTAGYILWLSMEYFTWTNTLFSFFL